MKNLCRKSLCKGAEEGKIFPKKLCVFSADVVK